MSAHAYINITDVPIVLLATAAQRVDDNASVTLISFDGCPLVGKIAGAGQQVEFPFPRLLELRYGLVDWLAYHGISFTVAM
jgi:hypothetical protein